jgi:2-methylisocitrate lyase-like PEP mutase family enzyme
VREAFLTAGADVLFVEAARSEAELSRIARTFAGTPLVANMVEDGKTPFMSFEVLRELGYRIVLRPVAALLAITHRLEAIYAERASERVSFAHYNDIVGLPEALEFISQCEEA